MGGCRGFWDLCMVAGKWLLVWWVLWWLGFDMICSLMVMDGFQRWLVIGGFGGANGFSACGFRHFTSDWVGGACRCELEGGFGR